MTRRDQIGAFLATLSELNGPGDPGDWLKGLGPSIREVLVKAGPLAAALVARYLETSRFRPTPADLGELLQELRDEAAVRAERAKDRPACPACEDGVRVVRVARRQHGRILLQDRTVCACTCPAGQDWRDLMASPSKGAKRPAIKVRSFDEVRADLRDELVVPLSTGEDGLLAWDILDEERPAPWPPSDVLQAMTREAST